MNVSDRVTSYLRTVIPVLWGSLIGLLLPHATWLPPEVVEWLSGDVAVGAATAAAIAVWYVAWRHLEPRVPDWLVRIALGSAAAPSYGPVFTPVLPDTDETEQPDFRP